MTVEKAQTLYRRVEEGDKVYLVETRVGQRWPSKYYSGSFKEVGGYQKFSDKLRDFHVNEEGKIQHGPGGDGTFSFKAYLGDSGRWLRWGDLLLVSPPPGSEIISQKQLDDIRAQAQAEAETIRRARLITAVKVGGLRAYIRGLAASENRDESHYSFRARVRELAELAVAGTFDKPEQERPPLTELVEELGRLITDRGDRIRELENGVRDNLRHARWALRNLRVEEEV